MKSLQSKIYIKNFRIKEIFMNTNFCSQSRVLYLGCSSSARIAGAGRSLSWSGYLFNLDVLYIYMCIFLTFPENLGFWTYEPNRALLTSELKLLLQSEGPEYRLAELKIIGAVKKWYPRNGALARRKSGVDRRI